MHCNNCTAIVAANLPADAVAKQMAGSVCGIYMGWAGLASRGVFKMVMSVGWNPYFDNKVKSVVSKWALCVRSVVVLQTSSVSHLGLGLILRD